MQTYPEIGNLYTLIREFNQIIFAKQSEKLSEWIEKIERLGIPELKTYANGVRNDVVAIKNGIDFEYNNGIAEGSVNKIKVIKRIMYGRSSFELLKSKVLLMNSFAVNSTNIGKNL